MPHRTAANRCPACHDHAPHTLDWPVSGLGESVFNTTTAFHNCPGCGLVYAANLDDATLARFYQEECAYFTSSHFSVNSRENIEKFDTYHKLLVEAGLRDRNILDVGCGRGGFLSWLKQNQWQGECQGVDADLRSIPTQELANFMQGDAFHLPAADNSQEVLTYFHVLEHLRDLDRALKEATRVLKDDGYLLLEVPDAERYAKMPIGTAFWFGIREHVNHFSPASLEKLLHRNGLTILRIDRGILPTPEFTYPSLLLLAQKDTEKKPATFTATGTIVDFLWTSQIAQSEQATWVSEVMADYERSVFWGCSAQLFSLLPLLDLSRATLCDASPTKQQSHFRGMPILAPGDIYPARSALFIAPYLHRPAIAKAAQTHGWPESHIYALE